MFGVVTDIYKSFSEIKLTNLSNSMLMRKLHTQAVLNPIPAGPTYIKLIYNIKLMIIFS